MSDRAGDRTRVRVLAVTVLLFILFCSAMGIELWRTLGAVVTCAVVMVAAHLAGYRGGA